MLRRMLPRITNVKNLLSRRPKGPLLGRIFTAAAMLLVGGGAFLLGRNIGVPSVGAQQPRFVDVNATKPNTAHLYSEEYNGRVVAYIYNNEPITRADFAEFLIARHGAERLDFFVNRMIVERACKQAGVYVTDAEVEDQFRRDIQAMGPHMTAEKFQSQILSRYKKTNFEWKEDVIRPKIMMTKLVGPKVIVTEDDLRKGFEARFGAKVQCRMIVFENKNMAIKAWQKIREAGPGNQETAFRTEAKQQYLPNMAATAGEVPPIHKHFGDPRIERVAFAMQPGEISEVIEMQDQTAVVLFCERHLFADPLRSMEKERIPLTEEIRVLKMGTEIGQYVTKLREEARPRPLLGRQPGIDQISYDSEKELDLKNRK